MVRRNSNVTFIDELQDLEDIDTPINRETQNQQSPQNDLKYQKYIRGYSTPPNESGMNLNNNKNQNMMDQHYNQYMNQHTNENYNQNQQYMNVNDLPMNYDQEYNMPHVTTPVNQSRTNQNMNSESYEVEHIVNFKMPDTLNCRDVAKHTANCPVCSKLYKNDKTMYWVIIFILVVICIMLFNKVLDNKYHN